MGENSTESTRQLKVSRLLQKELGTYFQREASSICHGKLITVTRVRITPDLSLARVYLSFFPSGQAKDDLIAVKARLKTIRTKLAQVVKNQLRIVPDLEFFIDDSLDYIYHIDDLMKK
jgi:ribosome-binding factor A